MDQPEFPYESIDNYLLGRMDGAEATAFEEEMANDSALKQEVSFQKSVISGVKEARRQQLKARLSDIPVSASPWAGAMQSTWLKVTTGIVVAGGLSIAAYYQLDKDHSSAEIVEEYITISTPVEAEEVGVVELPSKVELENNIESANYEPAISAIEASEERKFEETPKVVLPDVSVPQPVNPGNSNNLEEEEFDTSTESFSVDTNSSPVTVEVVQSAESRSYRYFDGVLGLKGDFDNITYDILEINDQEGRRLFLLIDGVYYGMTSTESYKPLVKIEDKKLSKQLDVLREYK
jgi:hypothetical protein